MTLPSVTILLTGDADSGSVSVINTHTDAPRTGAFVLVGPGVQLLG